MTYLLASLILTTAPAQVPTISIEVVSDSRPSPANTQLLQSLNAEATGWASRFARVHASKWNRLGNVDIRETIRMPLSLPTGLTESDARFRRGEFLSGSVQLDFAGSTIRQLPFALVWGDGEWTRHPMDDVLRAYVRKAVDKGLGQLLPHRNRAADLAAEEWFY